MLMEKYAAIPKKLLKHLLIIEDFQRNQALRLKQQEDERKRQNLSIYYKIPKYKAGQPQRRMIENEEFEEDAMG